MTVRAPRLSIPAPVARLVALLPSWPPAFALARALDLGIGRVVTLEQLAPLRGKRIELRVTDLGLAMRVEATGSSFRPARAQDPPDLVVAARLADFVALALRVEDPDTLFFARRLEVEGDTELGLALKNLLDGIDWDAILSRLPRLAISWRR